MPAESILLVDDDTSVLDLERMYLEREGFRIFSVRTGFDALNSSRTLHPDLIVLSLVLSGLDGYEVCRRLRSDNDQVPILAVFPKQVSSAEPMEDLEADDYLEKPFNPRELVARVRTILRQVRPPAQRVKTILQIKDVKIDQQKRAVTIGGKTLSLRMLEYELLTLLIREQGKFLSPEYLLREGWGYDFSGQTAAVGIHMSRLRAKLAGSGLEILSDPQAGYQVKS